MATTTTAVASSVPTFNLTYDQKIPSNFGDAYAQGIASLGQSIAGVIGSVGGKALEMSDQNRTANDMLTQLSQMKDSQGNPMLSKEDYDNIMQKGLGAKHAFVGEMMGRFQSQYTSLLDQQKQIAVQRAAQAGAAPYRLQEITTTAEQQRKTDAENARIQAQLEKLKNPGSRLITPQEPVKPTNPPASGADAIKSPIAITLDRAKNPGLIPSIGLNLLK